MEVEPSQLASPTDDADSLISTNDPDTMANEQTWPTDEEMRGAGEDLHVSGEQKLPDAKLGTTPKVVKKVPKGTSTYQAAWIVEAEEEEEGSEAGSSQNGAEENEEMQEMEMEEPVVHDEEMDESERKSIVAFKDLDEEEEDKQ